MDCLFVWGGIGVALVVEMRGVSWGGGVGEGGNCFFFFVSVSLSFFPIGYL